MWTVGREPGAQAQSRTLPPQRAARRAPEVLFGRAKTCCRREVEPTRVVLPKEPHSWLQLISKTCPIKHRRDFVGLGNSCARHRPTTTYFLSTETSLLGRSTPRLTTIWPASALDRRPPADRLPNAPSCGWRSAARACRRNACSARASDRDNASSTAREATQCHNPHLGSGPCLALPDRGQPGSAGGPGERRVVPVVHGL